GFGYGGYRTSARFDSLLAKVIVQASNLPAAAAKARRALAEFRIAGAPTNIGFLQALLAHPAVAAGDVHTRFIEEAMGQLSAAPAPAPRHFEIAAAGAPKRAGAQIDASDPLAVLHHGKAQVEAEDNDEE